MFQGRFKSAAVSPEEWGLKLSRYVHWNPVRIQGLGLRKQERWAQRMGLCAAPHAEVVRQRWAILRGYRWSSYGAYAGLGVAPEWLECGG